MKNRDKPTREWMLLSTYADGQLSARQKRKAEKLLKQSPVARHLLDEIHTIRKLLVSLPEIKAPRNFTLQSAPIRKIQVPSFFRVMQFSAATAAVLLVFVLLMNFFPTLNPLYTGTAKRLDQVEMMAVETIEKDRSDSPDIIFWGEGPAQTNQYKFGFGKGGGSDAGIGGGGDAGAFGLPSYSELPMEEVFIEEFSPEETMSASDEIIPEKESVAEEKAPELTQVDTHPILGIRPKEERGQIQFDQAPAVSRINEQAPASLLLIEIVLGSLFLIAFILMRIFRHRK